MFVFLVNYSHQVAFDAQELVLRSDIVRMPVVERSRWHRTGATFNGDAILYGTATREVLRLRNTQTRQHIINISTCIADSEVYEYMTGQSLRS